MGRGPDHDHTPLARSELVPRDHASSDSGTKAFLVISVAPMECNYEGSNSEGHE